MYVTLSAEPLMPCTGTAISKPTTCDQAARRLRTCHAGTHLFREGDEAVHLYEVASGVLRLTRVLENGKRQVIAFGLPGDIVGFPNGSRHHTDCDVLSTAEIMPLSRRAFEGGESDPKTHRRLMQAALREISAMQDHVMMLARKSALEKVASFLIALTLKTGTPDGDCTAVSLPMSRADIADFLGLSIETVSRTFSQLRKSGTIILETPQHVLIRDLDALIDASQSED